MPIADAVDSDESGGGGSCSRFVSLDDDSWEGGGRQTRVQGG